MLSPAFSERTLKDQEQILHTYIDLFIKRLHEVSEEGKKPMEMTVWWNSLTFDVIGYLAYGESFNCLTSPKLHDWIEATLNIAILMSLGQAGRQLPAPFNKMYKKWAIPESVRRNAKLHSDLTKEKLHNRLQNEPSHMDVVNRMIAAYKNGEVPYDVLKEHASILTIGGSETTATLLAGATYYLGTNPVVFRKLADEVRAAFARDEDITVAGTNGCPYLLACIEESLRIYPPSPANHTRITPPEGIVLDGRFVPGGMAVGMPMYAAFRSGSNFRNADRFVPERWLGDEEYAQDKKLSLQPFSVGPRNCLGRALAYQEIKLALAKLVWHFDVELRPESKNWLDQQNFTFWVKPQLWVNITPARRR
ncbi:putative cytochrome p450 monooxygenase protein [Neofusicoccum parvum UCRNP2]|uniref:Putative cytochrome p450 monooxygenase protein n=1 Tax=Botryosphaeria parva (strain UCR-NP2) TaxID=1287680 RepID=R1EZW2_BOTPV|nr:putative cytochrome p450 monooxygenase protein [Neofusicoccum parvum UCRNP2]